MQSPGDCKEVSVNLTQGASWRLDSGLSIDGRASLVVCERDVATLTPERREVLLRIRGQLAAEKHFTMLPICLRAQGIEDGKVAEHYRTEYDAMVQRFNAALESPVVRRVDCAFGWTHYDDVGGPTSGVR